MTGRWRGAALSEKVKAVVLVGAVAWFALITLYFFRSNFPLIHNDQQPLGVFSGLVGPWSFSLAQTPPLQFLAAIFHALLTTLFGALVLMGLRVRGRATIMLALSFATGFGLSGIAFTLLTMARCLYTPAVWCLWVLLLAGAIFFARKRGALSPSLLLEHEPLTVETRGERAWWWAAVVITALITVTTFWHALFYAETYWDSLILYLGYGRMTFLQHAFPFKAEVQVGIGLGANYPHLYSNYAAVASTMFAQWSDLHARLAAPLAGLGATILVYETTRLMWGRRVPAAMVALLFRAVPNGIAYSTYASDYAFTLFYTAALIAALAYYAKTRAPGWLLLSAIIPGIAMNLNYLMGVLWVAWGIAILAISVAEHRSAARAFAILRTRLFWLALLIGIALGSPWYIRNAVLTRNPVYAFFPQIFTSSVRMNRQVLDSANLEWFRNGDGVGRTAEFIHDFRRGVPTRDTASPDFRREATVGDRIAGSFLYWVGFDAVLRPASPNEATRLGIWRYRILHLLKIGVVDPAETRMITDTHGVLRWQQAYKMMVLFPALFFPALLLCPIRIIFLPRRDLGDVAIVSIVTALSLSALFLAYEYLIADIYLYQIIPILAPAAIVASFIIFSAARNRFLAPVVYTLVLVQGLAPGLAFGLMGFKFTGAQRMAGEFYAQTNLAAFRHPGIPSPQFYRLRYGADVDMWDYMNEQLKGQKVLTHENRHYVFDPSITFIHLDDWAMQQGYDLAAASDTATFLQQGDIRYYLRVPNEANHVINARLGMDRLIAEGFAKEIFRAGDNVLYQLKDTP